MRTIRFKNDTGDLTASSSGVLPAVIGETIEQFNGTFPVGKIKFMRRVSKDNVVLKEQKEIDKIKAEDAFDINLVMLQIAEVQNSEKLLSLASVIRLFELYGSSKNFKKIKDMGKLLVSSGKLTQKEFDDIKLLFASQNINIDDY